MFRYALTDSRRSAAPRGWLQSRLSGRGHCSSPCRLRVRRTAVAIDLRSLSEQGPRRVAVSAIHQRQAVVISAIVCRAPKPVPNPVPNRWRKWQLRASCGPNKAATAARDAELKPILEAMRDRTLREIAEALTNRGIKTPRGGDTWNQVTVMRSMRRLGIAAE